MNKEDFEKLKVYEKWDLIYNLLIKNINETKTENKTDYINRLNEIEDLVYQLNDKLNKTIIDINKVLDKRGYK